MQTYKLVYNGKEELVEAPDWNYATDIADDTAEYYGCQARIEDLNEWNKYYVANPPIQPVRF